MAAEVDVSGGKPLMLPMFMYERKSKTEPMSMPVMGLPLKRVIPMELHSMMDYANAGTLAATASMADSKEAKTAGVVLAIAGAGVSLLTDYDLSVAKVIPIEVHETLDYVVGAASIAAPFLLGYWKKDPFVAVMQIFSGAATILGSLVTDYRAAKGVTWGGWPAR